MLGFECIARGLNVGPLLAAIPARWGDITLRQDYPGSAHHDTECIFLRGPIPTTTDPQNELDSEMYPAGHELGAHVDVLFHAIGLPIAELGRVMLVSLKPGGQIDRHADEGAYADHFSRFHVPLLAAPGNAFTVHTAYQAETVQMRSGECWWFDHRREHEVRNDSPQPRIHLIFDARVSRLYREH